MTHKFSTSVLGVALVAALAAPAFAQDTTVTVEDFIGRIVWSNGPLDVLDIEKGQDLDVDSRRNALTLDGNQDIKGTNCRGYYGRYEINSSSGIWGGYEDLEDYPKIELSLPDSTALVLRNSVIFTEGQPDLSSADMNIRNCGDINLGHVTTVNFDSSGSADLTLKDVETLTIKTNGSSDVEAESVENLDLNVNGSGDFAAESVDNLTVYLSGSGDVEVDTVGIARITSRGSSDIEIETLSTTLDYTSNGSGDLSIDEVDLEGAMLSLNGSGNAEISDGFIKMLVVEANGSSSVDFDVEIGDAELRATGSADIDIDRVTGDLEQSSSRGADINVDSRD